MIYYNFCIRKSQNLNYTRMPGGSFCGLEPSFYDLKDTNIRRIYKENKRMMCVNIALKLNDERKGYIRALNNMGEKELDCISDSKKLLIDRSYEDFINQIFYMLPE